MRLRNWLFDHFAEVSRLFGFEMVEGPVLELEELFTRKAGEEIVDQLYNFEARLAGCLGREGVTYAPGKCLNAQRTRGERKAGPF